jgi:5'-nucleotidase
MMTIDGQSLGLKILLTNDDGFRAPGITAMRKVLIENGHKVTLVAPLGNQSGSSAKLTISGTLNCQEYEDRVWSVDGSPADAVSLAIHQIMTLDLPDLVISGVNSGQNLGSDINISGTVGAVVFARRLGIPGIAVSVGFDPKESNVKPKRYPGTYAAFKPAAQFIAELIDELQDSREELELLLPGRIVLNVNYPPLNSEKIRGVRLVKISRKGGFIISYQKTDMSGQIVPRLEIATHDDSPEVTDLKLFLEGYITLSALDGSWSVGQDSYSLMAERLKSIIK